MIKKELFMEKERLFKEFGIEPLDEKIFPIQKRNELLLKRKLFIGCRGKDLLKRIFQDGEKFYVLTGIMPSYEKIHLGTFLIIEAMKFFQDISEINVVLVADVESFLTRDVTYEEARKYALEQHIPAYLALGLNVDRTIFYFQSENKDLIKIASDVAREISLSTFRGVYGDLSVERILASIYQIADILFPQLVKPLHGIIPVGLDQDPHLRLTRDYIRKTKTFNFKEVAGIYVDALPDLVDPKEKMSKSRPTSAIFLLEDEKSIGRKIKKAFSGGGATLEEHRKKGANLEVDVCYKILRVIDRSKEFEKVVEEYKSGRMLSGEFKQYTFQTLLNFMKDFKEKFLYFQDLVKRREINLIKGSDDLKVFLKI
jgi:tryptophanyl-tRNA synthetase